MGKYMDVLEAISSESDASDEGEQGEGQPSTSEAAAAATAKRQKKEITVADLARAGYRSGPSVLTIRAPQEESAQLNYAWSDGRDARSSQVAETVEDRLATQHAALVGAETTARHAVATAQEAERIRELRRKEREEEVAERKKESFNQKEKRKRDEGKQARGKSYVEEEKRLQRQFGVYSGFDN